MLKAKEDVLTNFTELLETELQCSICNELFVQVIVSPFNSKAYMQCQAVTAVCNIFGNRGGVKPFCLRGVNFRHNMQAIALYYFCVPAVYAFTKFNERIRPCDFFCFN